MKSILVFDHVNDVIYAKYNKKFILHINEYARKEKLIGEQQNKTKIIPNVMMQIFAPIVTSVRILSCQFGNSYTSFQCINGMNLTFEEYMGYLFLCISHDEVPVMKRLLNICVTMVRYLCGPDVLLLKNSLQLASLLTKLLDACSYLQNNDEGMCVEAIEQLVVNPDLTTATLQALQAAVEKLQSVTECNKIHGLILVENKFLGLYSSQAAKALSPTDTLFTTILTETNNKNRNQEVDSDSESDEEFFSPSSTPNYTNSNLNELFQPETTDTASYQVLLSGLEFHPKCIPYAIHVKQLFEGVNLILLMEIGNSTISSSLYNTFLNIHIIQVVQIQGDTETLRPAFESLDNSIKKLCDGLRKVKNNAIEFCYRQLMKRWDLMRKKYIEFLKTRAMEALTRAESSTSSLLMTLKEVLSLTAFDHTILKTSQRHIDEIANMMKRKLFSYNEFFKVKAMRNFSLGSSSLTMIKYIEEFPGLVHFIYIDRINHRVVTPGTNFNFEETINLTKRKIWNMIHFSRRHLQEGHLSLMWKDRTFNYTYFLWFEDITGAPIKPTVFPTNASRALPQSGIICGDFYQKLRELCFPKMNPSKVRCYEVYCIHLGLATASCVLEHTRRLAATIWEVRAHPNCALDLI